MSAYVVALLIPLAAFAMWLGFNLILVKWHGLDALDKTRKLYQFRPTDWLTGRGVGEQKGSEERVSTPDEDRPDELPPAA